MSEHNLCSTDDGDDGEDSAKSLLMCARETRRNPDNALRLCCSSYKQQVKIAVISVIVVIGLERRPSVISLIARHRMCAEPTLRH